MPRPLVYVCSACARVTRELDALTEALADVAEVRRVKCQKVCDGPVVGTQVAGTLEWFRRVDTQKARRRLVQLLETGEMRNALVKRRVRDRRGKLR